MLDHAQLVQIEQGLVFVENTQHNFLAEQPRQRTKTQIDLFAAGVHLDAAVLRQPTFCDIQVGHNLQPRHDRCVQLGIQRREFVQHAVDAQPDAAFVPGRFDVDIAGAIANRALDHRIDHIDDRAAFRHFINL